MEDKKGKQKSDKKHSKSQLRNVAEKNGKDNEEKSNKNKRNKINSSCTMSVESQSKELTYPKQTERCQQKVKNTISNDKNSNQSSRNHRGKSVVQDHGKRSDNLNSSNRNNYQNIYASSIQGMSVNSIVISESLSRFWKTLKGFFADSFHKNHDQNKNLKAIENVLNVNDESHSLWMQCWSAGANGYTIDIEILPKILLMLPDTKTALPPPSQVVKVLSAIVDNINYKTSNGQKQKHTSNQNSFNPFFADLEVIVNVIRDRLNGPSHLYSSNYLDVEISQMANLVSMLSSKFKNTVCEIVKLYPTDCERLGQLLSRQKTFLEFEESIRNLPSTSIKKYDSVGSSDHNSELQLTLNSNVKPWLGWRDHATIGWLMSRGWLHVPELKTRYTDSNEYAECMLRMWTLLTFYWGAGAVWPKCAHKDHKNPDDMGCGEPLLAPGFHNSRCSVRYNGHVCDKPASWKCFRYNHGAICESCLNSQQTMLIGSPSNHASTDIYDAVVDRETVRRDGSVYIASKLNSRKPPRIPPNWKTTYRLQPSQLIGVIKLGSKGEPMMRKHEIHWAEVVNVNPQNIPPEHESRKYGKIAFRLLTRNDIPALSADDTVLDIGTCIAIIDLRVFVPEVISVLSTFAQNTFPSHLEKIPFIDCLIGRSAGFRLNFNPKASKTVTIENAIRSSNIELITRLPPVHLKRFIQRVCQLKQVSTLYGTQLEAFASGLAGAVHCTQGPPGTGKSYVGVALVIAFMILREESQNAGYSVGPVLMLSYKNHALDEFLCDVVDFAFPKLCRGELIRTGKPENPKLMGFCEQNSMEEKEANDQLNHRVSIIRKSQKIVRDWKDCSSYFNMKVSPESSWTSQIETETRQHKSESVCLAFALVLFTKYLKFTDVSLQESTDNKAKLAFNLLSATYNHPILEDFVFEIKKELTSFVTQCVHWKSPAEAQNAYSGADLEFWLHSWLAGKQPPPRCKASMSHLAKGELVTEQCMEISKTGKDYCNMFHLCKSNDCSYERVEGYPFCTTHNCEYQTEDSPKCFFERYAIGKFCLNHTCVGCLDNFSNGMITSKDILPIEKDQICCQNHRCGFIFSNNRNRCHHMKLQPFQYCEDHCCKVCLQEGIEYDNPIICVSKYGMGYCASHKCQVENCYNKAINGSVLCLDHTCLQCALSDQQNCVDLSVPGSNICYNHRCKYQESPCLNVVLENSPYCIDHTCRVCLELNIFPPLGEVTEKLPRNVCSMHPLCIAIYDKGTSCNARTESVDSESPYCERHNQIHETESQSYELLNEDVTKDQSNEKVPNDATCTGIKKKGGNCKNKQNLGIYHGVVLCFDHRTQATNKKASNNSNNKNIDTKNIMKKQADGEAEEIQHIQNIKKASAMYLGNSTKMLNKMKDELFNKEQMNQSFANISQCGGSICTNPHIPCPIKLYNNYCKSGFCAKHNRDIDKSLHELQQEDEIIIVETFESSDNTLKNNDTTQLNSIDSVSSNNMIDVDVKPHHVNEDIVLTDIDINMNHELPDILPDAFDYVDGIRGDAAPDELDMLYDAFEDEQRNDEQIRLDEIIDRNNDDNDNGDDDSVISENDSVISKTQPVNQVSSTIGASHMGVGSMDENFARKLIQTWNWDMHLEDRWKSVSQFLLIMSAIITKLKSLADEYVVDARRRKSEAGAQAFRKAKVVGATVVGAARRLEAIRVAEPFAVIVEESCEVMEPTLIAVLGIKSLRKLEMIGDHRQLPAFIQACWYNLESSHPTIKVSLFERLVEGNNSKRKQNNRSRPTSSEEEEGIPLQCSILDEQRRMRSCIADLTRSEYVDLVNITDHEHTSVQAVGDVFLRSCKDKKLKTECEMNRMLWETKGREVPGVLPSVYFWDLPGNREGRPVAGLSACNQVEADAIGHLVKHLINCGVPSTSISVITPYKGQKSAIINVFRKMEILPRYNRNELPPESVIVSTVDRYQGDENDIVILSLVRTRPGNRFVALRNRFIVAVSRARLGCYVVGSVDAVAKDMNGREGPSHWKRFITDLQDSNSTCLSSNIKKISSSSISSTSVMRCNENEMEEQDDNNKDVEYEEAEDDDEEEEVDSQVQVDLIEKTLKTNDFVFNAARVGQTLPICCPRHRNSSTKLITSMSDFPTKSNWNAFCRESCTYTLPSCNHLCQNLCHSPSVIPHTESCGVRINSPCTIHSDRMLVCSEVRGTKNSLDEAIKSFKCEVEVVYHRPECNHTELLPCFKNVDIMSNTPSLVLDKCKVLVSDFIHPRCGHIIKNPTCFDRRKYEANPPNCDIMVQHQRPCGCKVTMQCHQKIKESDKEVPSKCLVDVSVPRPRCGHILSLRCFMKSQLVNDMKKHIDDTFLNTIEISSNKLPVLVKHGYSYCCPESDVMPSIPKCCVNVDYENACGHILKNVQCYKAFQYANNQLALEPCSTLVPFMNPLCLHTINIPCGLATTLKNWMPWGEGIEPEVDEKGAVILEKLLKQCSIQNLSPEAIHIFKKSCNKSVTIRRLCHADHKETVSCSTLYDILLNRQMLRKCNHNVSRLLLCGHNATVSCHTRFDDPPLCQEIVPDIYSYTCGIASHYFVPGKCCKLQAIRAKNPPPDCPFQVNANRFRCNHPVTVECGISHKVIEYAIGSRLSDQENCNLVLEDELYCKPETDIPLCLESIAFQRSCGHIKSKVPCHTAFAYADKTMKPPACDVIESVESPLCNHSISIPCSMKSVLESWQPWGELDEQKPVYDETVDEIIRTGNNENNGECKNFNVIRVLHEISKPLPTVLPNDIVPQLLNCNNKLVYLRNCGHSLHINCVDAWFGTILKRDCLEEVVVNCKDCNQPTSYTCHSYNLQKASGMFRPCVKTCEKPCGICNINTVKTECGNIDPKCNNVVKGNLKCGHAVEWRCGKDNDPRIQTSPCRACTIDAWSVITKSLKDQNIKNKSLSPEQQIVYKDALINVIKKSIAEYEILNMMPFDRDIANFYNSRYRIIMDYFNLLKSDPKSAVLPAPDVFLSELDMRNYHIVYKVIPKNLFESTKTKQQLSEFLLKRISSVYGQGQKAFLLTNPLQLAEHEPSDSANGVLKVVFGIAYSLKALTDTPPFEGNTGNNSKALQKANEKSKKFHMLGYDCVLFRQIENSKIQPVVYWEPSLIYPLCCIEMKIHVKCVICQDYYESKDGFFCSKRHFVCWGGCFKAYVHSASGPDVVGRPVDADGNLTCPECKESYNLQRVGMEGPEDSFQLLLDLKMKIRSDKEVDVAVKMEAERVKAQYDKIMAIQNRDDREAAQIHLEIVENILTLRCPRCKLAFADYDGCAALTCHNKNCSCGFCSLCLQDCGSDAHSHVPRCPLNVVGGVYINENIFHQVHRDRRQRLIIERLKKETQTIQNKVKQLLKQDLKDLRIEIP